MHPATSSSLTNFTTNTKSERGGRTFFETGYVTHVGVAEPFCTKLSDILYKSVRKANGTVHKGGTFITIEGPRFSTRGESNIFRQWGCSIIGMTTSPEAYLAREAEIAYAVIAHVTDYDVWHVSEEPVTVEMVLETVSKNLSTIQQSITHAVEMIDEDAEYDSHNSLQMATMTAPDKMPQDVKEQLKHIIGHYDVG